MYDFNTCFGITPLGFELKYIDENKTTLDKETLEKLSYLYRLNMVSSMVVPYAKDIDLDKIQGTYVLVREPSNKLYIIAYTTDGEYVESDEALKYMDQMHGVALAHSDQEKYTK